MVSHVALPTTGSIVCQSVRSTLFHLIDYLPTILSCAFSRHDRQQQTVFRVNGSVIPVITLFLLILFTIGLFFIDKIPLLIELNFFGHRRMSYKFVVQFLGVIPCYTSVSHHRIGCDLYQSRCATNLNPSRKCSISEVAVAKGNRLYRRTVPLRSEKYFIQVRQLIFSK